VDGEEHLDPDNASSVSNTDLNTINDKFEHECLDKVVRLLNAHPIRQSKDDHVPGHNNSIQGLSGTKFLAHKVRAILLIVRRWVSDFDMPGVPVADEMGLGKTFTSVAAAMLCKLLTEKVVIGLLLSNLLRNTLEEWVDLAKNNIPGNIVDERKWYLLRRQNSMPRRLSEILLTPLQGHAALTSAFEQILVLTMPKGAETFKSIIDEMTYGTDFKLIALLHADNANLTDEDLNTITNEPENGWNIHHV